MCPKFLDFCLGFFASFFAWWIVSNGIVPHVSLGRLIKQEREGKQPLYRVHIQNNDPFFDVVDINLSGRVKIKGLYPDFPNEVTPYRLIIGFEDPAYIHHSVQGDNYWQPTIRIPNKSDLNVNYCKKNNKDPKDYRITIGQLQEFDLNLIISIEISIECSHKFSGARKKFTKEYSLDNIKNAETINKNPIIVQ